MRRTTRALRTAAAAAAAATVTATAATRTALPKEPAKARGWGGSNGGSADVKHPVVAAAEEIERDIDELWGLVAGDRPDAEGKRHPYSVARGLLFGCCERSPPPSMLVAGGRPRRRRHADAVADAIADGDPDAKAADEAPRLKGDPDYDDGASFS